MVLDSTTTVLIMLAVCKCSEPVRPAALAGMNAIIPAPTRRAPEPVVAIRGRAVRAIHAVLVEPGATTRAAVTRDLQDRTKEGRAFTYVRQSITTHHATPCLLRAAPLIIYIRPCKCPLSDGSVAYICTHVATQAMHRPYVSRLSDKLQR
jgi:hypothetical protein